MKWEGSCFASKSPAVANRELIPSCPSLLLGEDAEALEGAEMLLGSFRELRQDRWGRLGGAGQASAVSSCCRCVPCWAAQQPIFPGDRGRSQLTARELDLAPPRPQTPHQ